MLKGSLEKNKADLLVWAEVRKNINENWSNASKGIGREVFHRTADLQIKWAPLHPAILGLTTEVTDGIYFIQLNRGLTLEQTQKILMHELIHVYQFHYKLLEDLPNGSVKWMGEFYSWNLAWKDRPWEIHAEAWGNKLFVPDQP